MNKTALFIYIFIMSALMTGCDSSKKEKSKKLKIVATTSMIGDAAKVIAGDLVDIEILMGTGVDPHLYNATQKDLSTLASADLILYNGLHLEGKMSDVLKKLSSKKKVIAVAENIPTEKLHLVAKNTYDPHVWFDVSLWQIVVKAIEKGIEDTDKSNSKAFQANLKSYLEELDSLHNEVKNKINSIPKSQRILVTAHDAFGYFGKAYNIEVIGLQGISTISEPSLHDIASLVNLLTERKVKAVFIETSVSTKAIQAVIEGCRQKGHEVILGGSLYSDAMGEEGSPAGTYIGMVNANVQIISKALK